MTSIGGPCQCEVCGEWCSGGAIVHRNSCRLESAWSRGGDGTTACDCAPLALCRSAEEANAAAAEGAALGYRMRALLAEAERDDLDDSWRRKHSERCAELREVRISARLLDDDGECPSCDEVHDLLWRANNRGNTVQLVGRLHAHDTLAMHWGAELAALVDRLRVIIRHDEERMVEAHDASMRAYTIGRRDGLACAAQRDALVGDVVEAAKVWRVARMLRAPTEFERYCQLERAIDVLLAAEKPEGE